MRGATKVWGGSMQYEVCTEYIDQCCDAGECEPGEGIQSKVTFFVPETQDVVDIIMNTLSSCEWLYNNHCMYVMIQH